MIICEQIARNDARAASFSRNKRIEVDAMTSTEKRDFAKKIAHGLGHQSIIEHNIYTLDCLGISRFLAEQIGSMRNISTVEESQRYAPVTNLIEIAPEIDKHLLNEYRKMIEAKTPTDKVLMETARYILPMSVATNMFVTLNESSLYDLVAKLTYLATDELPNSEYPDWVGRELASVIGGLEAVIENFNTETLAKRMLSRGSSTITDDMSNMTYFTITTLPAWAKREIESRPTDLNRRVMECIQIKGSALVSNVCYQQLKRHRKLVVIPSPYRRSQMYMFDRENAFGPPEQNEVGPVPVIDLKYPMQLISSEVFLRVKDLLTEYIDHEDSSPLGATMRRVRVEGSVRAFANFFLQRITKHAQREIRLLAKQIFMTPDISSFYSIYEKGEA